MSSPVHHFLIRRIRLPKADSAFVYDIFESYEGILSYSTLLHQVGDLTRDLELRFPESSRGLVDELLRRLKAEDGVNWEEIT